MRTLRNVVIINKGFLIYLVLIIIVKEGQVILAVSAYNISTAGAQMTGNGPPCPSTGW